MIVSRETTHKMLSKAEQAARSTARSDGVYVESYQSKGRQVSELCSGVRRFLSPLVAAAAVDLSCALTSSAQCRRIRRVLPLGAAGL